MQQNQGFFSLFGWFSKEKFWMIEIIIGIGLLLIASFLLAHFIREARRRWKAQKFRWKVKLDYIFLTPLKVLFASVGLFYATEIVARQFGLDRMIGFIIPVRNAAIVVCITWMLLRWKKEIKDVLTQKSRGKKKVVDSVTWDFIGKLTSVAILFLAILVILQLFGIDVMPLVAFGGIGAAAIGFAAKDVIANLFGGLMLYILRPVTKGEIIEMPEKKIFGIVEEIGWYNSMVRDLQKVPLYVPNYLFSVSLIRNISRMTHRRIEDVISARYSDFPKLEDLLKEIREYIGKKKEIDQSLPIYINFENYSAYSIDFHIKCYVLETRFDRFLEIRQDVLFQVKRIMNSFGVDMPFPTTKIEGLEDLGKDFLKKV